jgi:hypothetical protein
MHGNSFAGCKRFLQKEQHIFFLRGGTPSIYLVIKKIKITRPDPLSIIFFFFFQIKSSFEAGYTWIVGDTTWNLSIL